MRIWAFVGILMLVGRIGAVAQDSIPLRSTFLFRDGFYRSSEDWRNNKPTVAWQGLQIQGLLQTATQQFELAGVRLPSGEPLPLDSIWGLCYQGRPYIRIPRDSISRELAIFARLQHLGNLSYFRYQTSVEREIEITAYNPATGAPFRRGKVRRTYSLTKEKLLRVLTGDIGDYTMANLATWMADAPDLAKAVALIRPEDPAERGFRALRAYNERKPIFLYRYPKP